MLDAVHYPALLRYYDWYKGRPVPLPQIKHDSQPAAGACRVQLGTQSDAGNREACLVYKKQHPGISCVVAGVLRPICKVSFHAVDVKLSDQSIKDILDREPRMQAKCDAPCTAGFMLLGFAEPCRLLDAPTQPTKTKVVTRVARCYSINSCVQGYRTSSLKLSSCCSNTLLVSPLGSSSCESLQLHSSKTLLTAHIWLNQRATQQPMQWMPPSSSSSSKCQQLCNTCTATTDTSCNHHCP